MKLKILNRFGFTSTTICNGRKIEYIVIHYTAGTTSRMGKARDVAAMFKRGSGGSADFIVDDAEIVQYNPEPHNRYCWAVGGSKYTRMTTSAGGRLYGICTNRNSISVEICSSKKNASKLGAEDTDWYFTYEALENAAALVRELMAEYGIDKDHVIMHHEVTGKICPNPWCVTADRLKEWQKFKGMLTDYEKFYKVTARDGLNIREKPNSTSRVLMTVPCGKLVKLIDTTTYTWWRVKKGNVRGYVCRSYLKFAKKKKK